MAEARGAPRRLSLPHVLPVPLWEGKKQAEFRFPPFDRSFLGPNVALEYSQEIPGLGGVSRRHEVAEPPGGKPAGEGEVAS